MLKCDKSYIITRETIIILANVSCHMLHVKSASCLAIRVELVFNPSQIKKEYLKWMKGCVKIVLPLGPKIEVVELGSARSNLVYSERQI